LQQVLGEQGAPYFGPELEKYPVEIAHRLWEGNRSMEEYAREVFPVEENANGLTWMIEGDDGEEEASEGIVLDFSTLNL
jgi:hypothetical protein